MAINIKVMKQRLLAKEAELQQHAATQTEAHPEPVSSLELHEGPQDFEETAVDFLEMQQEQAILYNDEALITEVQDALKRIEAGTYGRCVVCGQEIPEKRLEAIPWAARCVKDEAALEQRNLSELDTYDTDTR